MRRPNFIVFLSDDQGYGDLSCMGATDFRTPHLDRLASSGARFTSWYASSPVCSPSRASLLTGRYPGNAGVRSILRGHRTASGLPPAVPTLATALKARGYRTAHFGKWHLGSGAGNRPHEHGFDETFGFLAGCVDYYSHIFYFDMNMGGPGNNPTHDLWHNNREVYRNGRYLTSLITERAVDYVREAARADAPFFMYVAYNAPHYPMHAPNTYLERFPGLPWDRQIMAAMLSAMDDGVGEIVAELERQGIREQTAIFFQSDNGPSREARNWLDGRSDPYYGGSSGLLKGHKFSLFEGGIRVPAIMSWPERIPAGQVLDEPAIAMDVFPTFLGAAGGDSGAYELDGVDLLPLLAEGEMLPDRTLFWEMSGQTAVRRGLWKLVLKGQLVEGVPPGDEVYLADLETDMAEQHNLKDQHPDLAAELTATAEAWRALIEARWRREWLPSVEAGSFEEPA
ncbi:MAG: Arylsulfatase [uncultured Chloroflexia bacterium]|uniref:Arylsulfatase n=1 Tax=uncultured Chloroflexia bacterium TaxID=1672391 RepID=A0A6J4K994_9CHLR|nr:MAG: Arylsulfatase [uncultured Chloroflexia bacterium]